MGAIGLLFEAIEGVAMLVSATRRLRKAEREVEVAETSAPVVPPPPPPDPGPEAIAYVRGRDDATRAREQQESARAALEEFARRAAMGDEGEAEKPTEGGS